MGHMPTARLSCSHIGALLVSFAILLAADHVKAQGDIGATGEEQARPAVQASLQLAHTESPRETLKSFLQLTKELEDRLRDYQKDQSRANVNRPFLALDTQFRQLIDLSEIPKAQRQEVGQDIIGYLLDILGRLDLPPLESVPGAEDFDEEGPARWRVPQSPLTFVRIEEGPREGEFLFSARTAAVAPAFYRRIEHLPLRTSLEIDSWTRTIPQLHGPMIPSGLVAALPDALKSDRLDTPIWKILAVIVLALLSTVILVLWHRLVNWRAVDSRIGRGLQRSLTPALAILAVVVLSPFIAREVNISGAFAQGVDLFEAVVVIFAAVWLFWLLALTIFEWIILSPKIPDDSLDANLLRLCGRLLGFIGGVLIISLGAHDLGLPVLSLVAGLGIGGLAVALAIRPTLENLIGGAILYLDRPVRVGDFCSFGTHMGTVENIGVRSTQVRALDRTLISVPNAAFADMEIINWARCDRMLILTTIGLRYETDPDQLRYLLAKLREMCHAHPKIDSETVRVRFAGYGDSSLDVEIRIYALTREWNDFFAIREDVFLRVNEIVRDSGTGFAFPSRTLYMGEDEGLDAQRSDAARESVKSWRRSGQLPFPRLNHRRIEELAGTLDYPPRGSPDADSAEASEAAEPLSATPEAERKEEPGHQP